MVYRYMRTLYTLYLDQLPLEEVVKGCVYVYRACAHSLRRRGPIPSIPIVLVGSRDVKASKTSELVMVKSQIVEAGVDKVSRGGSSKQLCVKI